MCAFFLPTLILSDFYVLFLTTIIAGLFISVFSVLRLPHSFLH